MVKKILGGVVGYVVTFVCMFISFSCIYLAMGADRAFTPGTFQVSTLWIVLSLVVVFVCAVIGGYVASLIGGGTAAKITAGIILVLQLIVIGIIATSTLPNEARTADVPNMAAMGKAYTPFWAVALQTVFSITGSLVGGGLRKGLKP